MKRSSSLALLCAVGLSVIPACSSRSEVDCTASTGACRDNEVCDAETRLCVLNVPPKVSVTAPAEGDVVTGDVVEVTGSATDDEGAVQAAEVSVDDGGSWIALDVDDEGRFQQEVAVAAIDGQPVKVRVRAKDALEQSTEAEVPVTVDNVAPKCGLIAPVATLVGGPMQGMLTVRFEATDGAGVASARTSLDDGKTFHAAVVEEGVIRHEWTLPQGVELDTALRVEVTDANGHVCEGRHALTVDTLAPLVTLLQPSGAQPIRAGGNGKASLSVQVAVQDRSPLMAAFDFDDGNAPWALAPAASIATGFEAVVPLPLEDHVLHEGSVRVEDAAGNATITPLHVLVDRVAPVISALSPAAGTQFNIAAMAGAADVDVTWTVTDGDPDLWTLHGPAQDSVHTTIEGNQLEVPISPNDNGKRYDVFLRVQDSFGNSTVVGTNFFVDVVAPSIVQWSHGHNARLTPRTLTVTFSEPVTALGNPQIVQLLPNPNGATGTMNGSVYTVPGLVGDSVYSATIAAGSVRDAAGNTGLGGSRTFHTEPVIPASGTTLLPTVAGFDAAADEDGVVTIATEVQTQGPYRLYWIDPKTGQISQRGENPTTGAYARMIQASASRSLNGLAADRVGGWHLSLFSPTLSITDGASGWFRNGSAYDPEADDLLVPVSPGCGDPANADRVGLLRRGTGAYERGGMSPEASQLTSAQRVATASPNVWAAVGLVYGNPSTLRINVRSCVCNGFGATCEFEGDILLGTSDNDFRRLSVASTFSRTLVVHGAATGSQLHETCYGVTAPACTGFCPPPSVTTQPAGLDVRLFVAPKWEGQKVLGARKIGSGAVELVERDLSSACFAPWSVLATMPNSSQLTVFRPIRVGTRSGILYLENGALKLWYP